MVIYAAACGDCSFLFENACDATVHHVAERHARNQDHEITYGSYDERNSPFTKEARITLTPEQHAVVAAIAARIAGRAK